MFETVLYIFIFVFIFQCLWSRRKLYAFSHQLPGPVALPLIGNGLLFNCKSEDIYDRMIDLVGKYGPVMRFWLGPKLVVVFTKLLHVEKILSSTKITYKGYIYKFMANVSGVGLITASGPKWKEHRKLIQPMINLKFVHIQLDIIQRHSKILINCLEKTVGTGFVDIQHILHRCCFDIIGEIVCGLNPNTQQGQNLQIFHDFEEFYNNVFTQMMKPWLHPSVIFNFTHYKKERDILMKRTREFFTMLIENSRQRTANNRDVEITEMPPIIDNIILIINQNPNFMNDLELFNHLITLFSASEDTATLIISSLCLCFGMYQEYQDIAANEIRDVFGELPRDVTNEDISKLKYIEMCIKEALRLFPIAPFIMRSCTEELSIGEYTLPVGCEVMIPIDLIHRDPKQWSDPHNFYPDHFLERNVKNRHFYAFIPFSAGPRACIGKHLAMHMLKVITATILQHFSFQAEGKYSDLKFKSDISLRVKTGYQVKISKRTWL